MKKIWETGMILFAMLGFWGMIYPDLCFTGDICAVVYESAVQEAAAEPEQDAFTRLCEAGPEQIRIKSRLWEGLEKESKGKSDVVDKRQGDTE